MRTKTYLKTTGTIAQASWLLGVGSMLIEKKYSKEVADI